MRFTRASHAVSQALRLVTSCILTLLVLTPLPSGCSVYDSGLVSRVGPDADRSKNEASRADPLIAPSKIHGDASADQSPDGPANAGRQGRQGDEDAGAGSVKCGDGQVN